MANNGIYKLIINIVYETKALTVKKASNSIVTSTISQWKIINSHLFLMLLLLSTQKIRYMPTLSTTGFILNICGVVKPIKATNLVSKYMYMHQFGKANISKKHNLGS